MVQEQETNHEQEDMDNRNNHIEQQQQQQQQLPRLFYSVNISIADVPFSGLRDDVWSCLVALVTFWFFAASMTLILGLYGSVNLQLGPNCSCLIEINPIFVKSIKVDEIDERKPGPMLYGFDKIPPMNVKTTWTETHNELILANFHKEWIYFLNSGSELDIFYRVKSPSSSPLSLVIAKGREDIVEWIEDPSYPNTTLSWNIIYGTGKIEHRISKSSNYYIAVGNLNTDDVEVELKFTVNALLYNTTRAHQNCSLGNSLCSLNFVLLGSSVAVLTSPGPMEGTSHEEWFVRLSYGPRWLTYFVGSGMMTALIFLAFRLCNLFQTTSENRPEFQPVHSVSERTPLLPNKDDDLSSWGSSYESFSRDEEDLAELLAVNNVEGNSTKEGNLNNNLRSLCVICCNSPRDCFFLPCGHSAACFTCATRLAEEPETCPICCRKLKKVRKIFTV
ncbi:RING/U-box superfamily protein [Quillaja saponaria]|uniref:RING/U-box superfamily protein n=1 Tax=Quillaja saponaria TaxID=32244 RepID=A0AAD7LU09_QUISA|nr:RING/U-box superfamily protein [Quillaja saponaria]